MFQQKTTGEDLEEVAISAADAGWSEEGKSLRLEKLLVLSGLAASGTEAARKLKENAVRVDDAVQTAPKIALASLPARLTLRVGKRAKVAVIS
jgi:tyrosyl-tRNA synthetase